MKFLPTLRPLALLGLALSFAACSTPANRRELYTVSDGNGPWHDYERRLDAAAATGVAPGDMGHAAGGSDVMPAANGNNTGATEVRGGRPTRQPKSSPLVPDATALPSGQSAPAAPVNVPVPTSPTTTDPSAPAAPGGATTAPPADPTSVPVVPPTT